METLYLITGLAWAVISIIMVVNFFQMSSDLRALKRHFIPNLEYHNEVSEYDPSEEIKGVIKSNGITYSILNEVATFSDGKTGFVKFSSQHKKWFFETTNIVSDKKLLLSGKTFLATAIG